VDVTGESSSTLLRGKSKSLHHLGGSACLGEIQWQMISDIDLQARAAVCRCQKLIADGRSINVWAGAVGDGDG